MGAVSDNSGENLRLFIEQAPAAIAMFDREMRYLAASRRWLSDYGLGDMDLHGMSHYQVFPEIPERWREVHRRGLGGEVVKATEDRFERADGTVQWLRWEVQPWYGAQGLGGILIFTDDITELKQAEEHILRLNAELEQRVRKRTEQLEESVAALRRALAEAEQLRHELHDQAIHDPLTGLFNRRYLQEVLEHEVSRAERADSVLGLIMFDIDNFKYLNDTFGHVAGDDVLKGVGEVVLANIRKEDIACRYGGDEFIIVMPDTPLSAAMGKASKLRAQLIASRLEIQDVQLPEVRFSMGVTAFPEHGSSATELLLSADAAMYRAKREGRDRVVGAG